MGRGRSTALFDSLPVWQNVSFRLLRGPLKRPPEYAREIAIEKLRRVGLKSWQADEAEKEPAREAEYEAPAASDTSGTKKPPSP